MTVTAMKGPIPPPEILSGYEQALPGAADRIMRMAENEQVHRHGLEEKDLRFGVSLVALGQICGLFVGLFGIGCGTLLLLRGCSITGFAALLGSLATLVTAFIYSQRQSTRRLSEKPRPPVTEPKQN